MDTCQRSLKGVIGKILSVAYIHAVKSNTTAVALHDKRNIRLIHGIREIGVTWSNTLLFRTTMDYKGSCPEGYDRHSRYQLG